MKIQLRYAYEFGKCDVSDWTPYEIELTEEEAAAYRKACLSDLSLYDALALEEVLLRARDELGEDDLEDGVRLLVEFDDQAEPPQYSLKGCESSIAIAAAKQDMGKRPKENILLRIGKSIIGFFVGLIVWYVVYMLSRLAIALIAQVPFLRYIIYYPSDASWALTVLPPTNAVFAGGFCSIKICNSAKPFSLVILATYAIDIVYTIMAATFTWPNLIIALISIGIALMFLFTKPDNT